MLSQITFNIYDIFWGSKCNDYSHNMLPKPLDDIAKALKKQNFSDKKTDQEEAEVEAVTKIFSSYVIFHGFFFYPPPPPPLPISTPLNHETLFDFESPFESLFFESFFGVIFFESPVWIACLSHIFE